MSIHEALRKSDDQVLPASNDRVSPARNDQVSPASNDQVSPAKDDSVRKSEHTLRVDWPACKAHGICAEILPEVVSLDQWGFPIVSGAVTDDVLEMARAAVKACPTLALRRTQPPRRP